MQSTTSTTLARMLEQRKQASTPKASTRLIRRPELEAMTGLPKSTLYDYLKDGTFPAPVKLSARSVAWRLSEVEAWIESRQSARPAKAA